MTSTWCLRLLLLACPAMLNAADTLATWQHGAGSIAGKPSASGDGITAGEDLATADGQPAIIALAGIDGATATLAAGSAISLTVDERHALIITLAAGDVQIDVRGQKLYSEIIVRGEVVDVHVTGTVFIVERVRHGENYVAMIEGKARLLKRVLKTGLLDPDVPGIDLLAHHGLDVNETGFATVEQLNNRPQLSVAAPGRDPIRLQGLVGLHDGGGWQHDAVQTLFILVAPPVEAPGPQEAMGEAAGVEVIYEQNMDFVDDSVNGATVNGISSGGKGTELFRIVVAPSNVRPIGVYPGPP